MRFSFQLTFSVLNPACFREATSYIVFILSASESSNGYSEKCKYTPKSDFAVLLEQAAVLLQSEQHESAEAKQDSKKSKKYSTLPMLIAENHSGDGTEDRPRMLMQAMCLARIYRYHSKTPSKPPIVNAVYVEKNLDITWYVFAALEDQKVITANIAGLRYNPLTEFR